MKGSMIFVLFCGLFCAYLPAHVQIPATSATTPTVSRLPTTALAQTVTSARGSVGFVGCSFSNNAVKGYQSLGGKRFWEPIPQYNGGSVTLWANGAQDNNRYWRGFAAALRDHPDTLLIWWQLCNSPQEDEETLYKNARLVLDEIRRRVPAALIYASAQHSYSGGHVCRGEPDGPARMQRLTERLVKEGLVMAGPVMGPLAENQTRDGCHANRDGREVLGQQLLTFFDKEMASASLNIPTLNVRMVRKCAAKAFSASVRTKS